MKKEEVDEIFEKAGVTFDDLHTYIRERYKLDEGYGSFNREDIEIVANRIKRWKNDRSCD